jgi:hypothetical protein
MMSDDEQHAANLTDKQTDSRFYLLGCLEVSGVVVCRSMI